MNQICAKLVIPAVGSGRKRRVLKKSAKDKLSERMKTLVSKKLKAHQEKAEAAEAAGEEQTDKQIEENKLQLELDATLAILPGVLTLTLGVWREVIGGCGGRSRGDVF